MKQRLWVTGYRSYELGIFDPHDPKLAVIKMALRNQLIQAIEDGCDWFITGGQMGVEQWCVEVAADLKAEYSGEFKTALMLPFQDFGHQWKETGQAALAQAKQKADFTATVSDQPYQNPQQLRNYQEFMLDHTERALMIYDGEHEGKPMYDYRAIQRYMDHNDYDLRMVDFDDLQEVANEYQENQNNGFQ